LICTEGHLYGHQTPQCPEFTDVYAGSNAINPKMQNFNTEIYAAWSETNADNRTQIRVKSYDGSSWSFVDGMQRRELTRITRKMRHIRN